MVKPITFQGQSNFNANLYALEVKSRFIDQSKANGYYTGYGDELNAQVVGKTIQVGTGAFVVQGRMCEITEAETVRPQIFNGFKGYVIARIETYHPADEDNCSIIAKIQTSFETLNAELEQSDVYAKTADNINTAYELPIYSFEISGTQIVNLTKLIKPVCDYATIKTIVDSALATANAADGKADAAVNTANAADGKADAAVNTANAADGKADAAIETADQAASDATNALTVANNLDAQIVAANASATAAVSTANAASAHADDIETYVSGALADQDAEIADLAEQIAEGQGTIVTINGVSQSTLAIDEYVPAEATHATSATTAAGYSSGGGIAKKFDELLRQFSDPAKAKIYGVDNVGSSSPTALTRTDDAVGKNVSVGTITITSDFDSCYPWSDITQYTDASGNVFIKIPKFYSKIVRNANGTYKHLISGVKYDGFTTLFVDANGNEIDYVAVGKYEGSGTSSRVYSKSGQTVLVNITQDAFRTACRANGAGYQQYDFLIDLIIKELFLVEMKTTNSQSIMYGYANGNSAAIQTGKTDTVSTASGSPTSNSSGKYACKYRGIENPWGNVFKWVDGISFSGANVYVCTDPSAYSAGSTASPYVRYGNRATSGSYVSKVEPLNASLNPLIQFATAASGSATTYYCDGYGYNANGVVLYVGGRWANATSAGLWYWSGSYAASYSSASVGGRLCYKPL